MVGVLMVVTVVVMAVLLLLSALQETGSYAMKWILRSLVCRLHLRRLVL